MRNQIFKLLAVLLSMLFVGWAALPTQASVADTSSSHIDLDGAENWFAIDSETGAVFTPEDLSMWEAAPTTARLLAIDDWTACWVWEDSNWKIATFLTTYLGSARTMSIQCGTATTHGYFHIALGESNHQQGWRNRITKANPSASTDSWDDLMWWSASQSWKNPLKTVDVGGGKICRPGLIEMYGPDSSGKMVLKYSFKPTFFWSVTQNRLVTAVPSTSPTC